MKRAGALVAALGAFLLCSPSATALPSTASASSTDSPGASGKSAGEVALERRIQELDGKIQASEARLADVQVQDSAVMDAMDSLNQTRRGVADDVAMALAAARASGEALESMRREVAAAREATMAQADMLAPRLWALQKLSAGNGADLLESATSFSAFLRRKRALALVMEGDMRWLRRAQATMAELDSKEMALAKAGELHRRRLLEATAREEAAGAKREELSARHGELSRKKKELDRELSALEAAQEEARTALEELKEGARVVPPPEPDLFAARHRGAMAFPAQGFIEVGFGRIVNPRFNTVTFQNGLDIRSPKGTPVVAVTSGTVVHAAPFRGYGNLMIVDHGEGYHSLYTHLDTMDLATGDQVAFGDRLGTVGDTGSDKGAFLHFELRKHGQPVDPREWFEGGK